MRIGVNTLFYIPGEVGGSETYLRQTLRAMTEVRPDLELVLFTNIENDGVLRSDLAGRRVSFDRLNCHATSRPSRIVREQVELPGRVRRAGIDVLWSPGYTACLTTRCQQVVTILDMQYKLFPEDLSGAAWIATDVLVRMGVRKCRRVLAISEFSKREVVRFTGVGSEKVDVTLLGVDPAFGENRGGVAQVNRPYLLSVSNTYPHKNMHCLVDAFAGLEDRIPHRLVVVGAARRGEDAFQAALARLKDPSRVTRLTGLDRDKLISLYQSADAFVFPSLYEGFGLPILEAMMAGVPVAAGRHASIPEIAGEHFVDCGQADADSLRKGILEILGWGAEGRNMRVAAGREHAGRFTWRRTAEGTLRVLGSVVAEGVDPTRDPA